MPDVEESLSVARHYALHFQGVAGDLKLGTP